MVVTLLFCILLAEHIDPSLQYYSSVLPCVEQTSGECSIRSHGYLSFLIVVIKPKTTSDMDFKTQIYNG